MLLNFSLKYEFWFKIFLGFLVKKYMGDSEQPIQVLGYTKFMGGGGRSPPAPMISIITRLVDSLASHCLLLLHHCHYTDGPHCFVTLIMIDYEIVVDYHCSLWWACRLNSRIGAQRKNRGPLPQ